MLNLVSKISYKFSTNAIFILFSIVADQLLTIEDFGKFIIVLAIQILIFNLSDIFNSKYLLGLFAQKNKNNNFQIIFSFKVIWGFILVIVFSFIYLFYELSLFQIIILFFINYIQLLSSTIATFIFSNERNKKLLFSNASGFLSSLITFSVIYYEMGKVTLSLLFVTILMYRVVELIYLYTTSNMKISFKKKVGNEQKFKDAFPFYFQILLSVGGNKLFILFLPLFLSYQNIAIIGTYEYIIAIPIFFISVITMSTYTQLFHKKLDINFDLKQYTILLNKYYVKAFLITFFFLLFQIIYIIYFKPILIEYICCLLVHTVTIVFSSIQGYLLFFWKRNRSIIFISIFSLVIKNSFMLFLIKFIGIWGYFITSILLELSVLLFIQYLIFRKIKKEQK